MLTSNKKKCESVFINMNIFIRTDSSIKIGTGHAMRCLNLAKTLKERGVNVCFICNNDKGNINDLIKSNNFSVYELPLNNEIDFEYTEFNWQFDVESTKRILLSQERVDWIIVDHYGIDEKWERSIRPFTNKIMVIDDLANRRHDCDLLLDNNLYLNMENRYNSLVPKNTIKLLGPRYLQFRSEFYETRKEIKIRDGTIKRLLISFGGTDETNETLKALKAIKLLSANVEADVVVGSQNENKEIIKAWCVENPNIKYHCQINYMAKLMKLADLSIGAGGTSTYERCYLGLPSLVIKTANNQSELIKSMEKLQLIHFLGENSEITEVDIANELQKFLSRPRLVKEMSKRCLEMFSNDIVENNLVDHILEG